MHAWMKEYKKEWIIIVNIQCFQCTKHCSQCFIKSLNPHTSLVGKFAITCILQMRKVRHARLNNVPKVTQLEEGEQSLKWGTKGCCKLGPRSKHWELGVSLFIRNLSPFSLHGGFLAKLPPEMCYFLEADLHPGGQNESGCCPDWLWRGAPAGPAWQLQGAEDGLLLPGRQGSRPLASSSGDRPAQGAPLWSLSRKPNVCLSGWLY